MMPLASTVVLAQLATARDTVLVRQLPPARSTFESVAFVAGGLSDILTLLLLVTLLGLLVWLWRGLVALRGELARMGTTVQETTDRVKRSVDGLAERVDAVSALVGRVARVGDAAADLAGDAARDLAGEAVDAMADRMRRRRRRRRRPNPRSDDDLT